MSQEKQQWGTRLGVILAVAGSAVGLGNFLRFPGNAAANGGGAFMIPYFIALLLLGIPIGWAEWTMGKYGGRKGFHSAPAILGVIGKGSIARYFGIIGVLIPLVVSFYYVLVESWCLLYFWEYLTGGVGIDSGQSIAQQAERSTELFTQVSASEQDGFTRDSTLLFWGATFAVNAFLLFRGLSKGIEAFCRAAMPIMVVCGILLLIRTLTLGTPDPTQPENSVLSGLSFMWEPDLEKLKDPGTWLAAAGQIFFRLSVGFGVIINYASYMRAKYDVVLSGLTASATNEFFEVVLGGLITIPAAVVFLGVGLVGENMGSSFSLGFKTLPVVFAHMPLGQFFGAVFFLMLFLAAVTSSLSMLFPAMAFVEEALGVNRKTSTVMIIATSLLGSGFVLYYSEGLTALDTIDFWVGTVLIFVLATVQIICFGWVWGIDKGMEEAAQGARMQIPRVFQIIIKYVTPAYLLAIFVLFCQEKLPGYVETIGETPSAQYTLGMILVIIGALLVMTTIGTKRWRAMGLDVDGREPAPPEQD